MTILDRWLRRPQSLLIRKMLFQVHLWTGIGIGLYLLLISVSGSVLVYRRELARTFGREPEIVAGPGGRMTPEELKHAAQRVYPDYTVTDVFPRRNPDLPVEIRLQRGEEKKQRLFHPYTGADLGNRVSFGLRSVEWLVQLHDNLLNGDSGRIANGVGGVLLTLLCLTGAVIWWPGVQSWRRSLAIDWKANGRRFHWSLHSAFGFWSIAFIFLWGVSGIYLSFPEPFDAVVEYLEPIDDASRVPRLGDTALFWLSRLHFGRFYGWTSRILWTVFGLVPVVLFITGSIMWWHRKLRNGVRQLE